MSFPATKEEKYWIRMGPLSLREEEEGSKLGISVPATPKSRVRVCNLCGCPGPAFGLV